MKSLFFFIFFSFHAHANNCQDVQVKIIFDKKTKISKEVLCTKKTPDNMLFYVSRSCVDDGCEILKRKKEMILIKDYYRSIGSPGFKLCEFLGGLPQIFEFSKDQTPKEWESTERCLFGDQDFVEISYLSREWKRFIKR